MKKINALLCAMVASLGASAQNGNLVFTTPDTGVQYMVSSLSPNGKWACGALYDDTQRAFLWNLTSGEIIELCVPGSNAAANGVSNDGIVSGSYETTVNTPNNVPTTTYGYWVKGKWNELQLENKENGSKLLRDGYAATISPNGKYIAGIGSTGDVYNPIVWENGKLTVIDSIQGSAFDISDDGKIVCGWTTHPVMNNRTSVVWQKGDDGKYTKKFIDLESDWAAGPFAVATGISPNNRYVCAFNSVLDLTTGDTIMHNFEYAMGGFQLNGVTDDGTCYGFHDPGEFPGGPTMSAMKISLDHKTVNLRDYFVEQGVDLEAYPYIQMAVGISNDEKTYALTGYDANFMPRSFIVKLGVDTLAMAPISLKSRQLEGLSAQHLSWKAPLKNNGALKGYNIYRNGVKLNQNLLSEPDYIDSQLSAGEYTYAVTAVYDSKESEQSELLTTNVLESKYQAPRLLSAYPSGYNDVRLLWEAPYSNLPSVKYYNLGDAFTGMGGDQLSFESAIAVRASELALYKKEGYQVSQISFVPRSKQKAWKVNFYTTDNHATPIYSEVIPSENLIYGTENYYTLKTPLTIPEGKDLIMAIAVDATGFGGYDVIAYSPVKADAGYSDLIRQEGEKDFYSLYDQAMNSEYGPYEFNARWAMAMHFAKPGDNNEVKQYIVLANGEQVNTTKEKQARLNNLADAKYQFDVIAEYTNGECSAPVSTNLDLVANQDVYKTITPSVETAGDKATVTWEAPVDNDAAVISFANDVCTGGIVGRKSNQYSYMLATIYDGAKLMPYEGFEITGFRFYPTSDADFTFFLKVNGKEVIDIPVDNGVGYVKNQWNTVKLDQPIQLNRNDKYMLMLDCYDVTPKEAPVGMDSQKGYPGRSDLYSTDDGENFTSIISDGGKDANWMIGLEVEATDKKALPVEGYNIYLSDQKQNEVPTTETTKVFNDLEAGTYEVRVNPVYGNGIGEKVSESVSFVIDLATGIENLANSTLEVIKNADKILVNGGQVSAIDIYGMDGAKVAQSTNNEVSIQALPAGVYVVKIQSEGKCVTTKISIR